MRSALSEVDGVDDVEIDFAAKTATVHCSEGCDPEALTAALEGTEFSATVR